MPYIGRELESGNYLKLDDISSSFDGSTTTFNLTAGGKAFFPGSAFSILVNLAGVAQEPEAAYQINNSQITFASAPASGDQFFCIVLGIALGANVPGNGTVNGAQLAKPFNYDGYFYLDDANNRVGVGTATPAKPLHVVGEGQFDSVRVLGDLTVDGTTTTLDTVVTEVDKLEVGANNSTVGVAITQSGSGDILNLYDGSSSVFSVADGGTVTASGDISIADKIIHTGDTNTAIRFPAVDTVTVETSGSERFRVTSAGNVGIGSLVPVGKLDVAGNVRIFEPSSTAARTLRITNSSQNLFLGVEGTSGGGNIVGSSAGDGTLSVNGNLRISANNGASANVSLLNSGSVGIGTITPQSQFEVYGSSPIVRSKHSTSQKYTQINHNGTDGYLDWSSGSLLFRGASNTERLRIDSNGNARLGPGGNITNSTNYSTLTLANTAGGDLEFVDSGNNNLIGDIIGAEGSGMYISSKQDTPIIFRTGASNTEKLRITSGGSVGIGNTASSNIKLDVEGSLRAKAAAYAAPTNGTGLEIYYVTGTLNDAPSGYLLSYDRDASAYKKINYDASDHKFRTSGIEKLRITSGGNIGINTTVSPSKVTIGSVSSPAFNRGAVAIKAMATDANCGTSGIYIEESSTDSGQGEGYNITVDADGDLNFHNSGAAAPTVTFADDDKVGIGTETPSQLLEIRGVEPRICLNGTTDDNEKGIEFEHLGQRRGSIFHNAGDGNLTISSGDNGSGYFINFKTDNTERLRITSGGLVGIGAFNNSSYDTNAQNVLIASDGNTGITIRSAGSSPYAMIHFADGTTGNSQKRAGRIVYQHDGDNLMFNTADTERLRITGDGKVRIGNSTITASTSADDLIIGLDSPGGDRGATIISGTSGTGNIFFSDTNTSGVGNRMGTITYDHSGNYMRFSTNGNNERLRIGSAGEVSLRRGGISAIPSLEIYGSGNASDAEADNLRFHNWGNSSGDYWDIGVNHGLDSSGNNTKSSNTLKAAAIRFSAKNGAVTLITSPSSTSTQYEGLTQNQSGQVTIPNQPGFIVRKSASETTWTISQGWQKIGFDEENLDRGGNFNTSTHEFTAPVAGMYLFGCELQLENPVGAGTGSWMYISFVVNGQTSLDESKGGTRCDVNFAGHTYNSYAPTHLLNLAANDKVSMYRTGGSFTSIKFKGGGESVFWGYLVG